MKKRKIINPVEIFHSAAELEQNAAERIVSTINKSIGERGVCFVALSGGETPRPVYRLLGTDLMKDRVDWKCVQLFFTDERAVPPDDPQSNYGMVHRELISKIGIPPGNVHRIKGELKPELAASEYEEELWEIFSSRNVRFDLVLLGLGEDGHTASIFPGSEIVKEENKFVAAIFVPRPSSWRVTLTFPGLNNAREILFLVSGRQKAAIVQRVLGASDPVQGLPASMVRPAEGKLLWMLDKDTAGDYGKL
jgi:6-phosphogluconolactonase